MHLSNLIQKLSGKANAIGAVAAVGVTGLGAYSFITDVHADAVKGDEKQLQPKLSKPAFYQLNEEPEVRKPKIAKMASVSTKLAPAAIGAYSQGMRSGGFLFTSGQIAMRPEDGVMIKNSSIEEECQLALSNLNAVLTAANCTKEDVVKTTVFLQDMDDFQRMNTVYEEFFQPHKPARSAIAVSKLPKGAKVEIEAVARLETHNIL